MTEASKRLQNNLKYGYLMGGAYSFGYLRKDYRFWGKEGTPVIIFSCYYN